MEIANYEPSPVPQPRPQQSPALMTPSVQPQPQQTEPVYEIDLHDPRHEPVFNFAVVPVVPVNRQRVELSEREKQVLRDLFIHRGVPRVHFGTHDFEIFAYQNAEFEGIMAKVTAAKGGNVTEARETIKRCVNYIAKNTKTRQAPDEPTTPAARLTPTRKKRTVPLEPPTSARSLDFGTEPVGPPQGLLPHERMKIRETFSVQGQAVLIVKAQVEHYMQTDHNGCANVLWAVLERKGGDWRKLLDTIRSTCKGVGN